MVSSATRPLAVSCQQLISRGEHQAAGYTQLSSDSELLRCLLQLTQTSVHGPDLNVHAWQHRPRFHPDPGTLQGGEVTRTLRQWLSSAGRAWSAGAADSDKYVSVACTAIQPAISAMRDDAMMASITRGMVVNVSREAMSQSMRTREGEARCTKLRAQGSIF